MNITGLGLQNTYSKQLNQTTPSFKGINTLTHTNIGSCMNGFIGKVRVRNAGGQEEFLNVIKKSLGNGYESYTINDDFEQIVGEMVIAIRKYNMETLPSTIKEDPSHVFVSELKNYSSPHTPFYNKKLTQHKDIGLRLLQIAQRRSDESMCQGNIKLITKNESKEWYKNYIGMQEEFPNEPTKFRFRINNPNQLYLPPHAKEPLSRMRGGL